MSSAELIKPVKVERDEDGRLILEPGDETDILDRLTDEARARVHVYRLGNMLGIGTGEEPITQGLIRYESPNDVHYAAMVAEASPGEVAHHPV